MMLIHRNIYVYRYSKMYTKLSTQNLELQTSLFNTQMLSLPGIKRILSIACSDSLTTRSMARYKGGNVN